MRERERKKWCIRKSIISLKEVVCSLSLQKFIGVLLFRVSFFLESLSLQRSNCFTDRAPKKISNIWIRTRKSFVFLVQSNVLFCFFFLLPGVVSFWLASTDLTRCQPLSFLIKTQTIENYLNFFCVYTSLSIFIIYTSLAYSQCLVNSTQVN